MPTIRIRKLVELVGDSQTRASVPTDELTSWPIHGFKSVIRTNWTALFGVSS